VGSYPEGESPYGALDMMGNVEEWTSSLVKSYPYDEEDGRENLAPGGRPVVRGGSWYHDLRGPRAAGRVEFEPSDAFTNLGFRCARSDS
jgi:formylglycine-generating enzyme required for sulfatase activity